MIVQQIHATCKIPDEDHSVVVQNLKSKESTFVCSRYFSNYLDKINIAFQDTFHRFSAVIITLSTTHVLILPFSSTLVTMNGILFIVFFVNNNNRRQHFNYVNVLWPL